MTTANYGYVNEGMELNFPYGFPHGSIVVEGRGRERYMQESWRLLENEADDA